MRSLLRCPSSLPRELNCGNRFFQKNIKAATISPSRRDSQEEAIEASQKQRLCCPGVQLQVSLELCGGESRHADGIVVLCFGYIRRGIISTEKATSAHHTIYNRMFLGTTPVFSFRGLKQLHKKDVFSYPFSEMHQFSSLRRSMNRCLWWLTSFSGQTFLALGYLQVVDISDNGRMLEEKGGVARWRCEDTVSFFPISKFIVHKSCGKPDHDHDRCFLMFFGTIFAICYPRLRESQKFPDVFQSHRKRKSGDPHFPLCFPTCHRWLFPPGWKPTFGDDAPSSIQNVQWLSNHKNTRKQKYLENVIPQMISWSKVHPGRRPLNSHSLFMDVFLLSDIPGLTRIGWCSCSNGGVLKHPIYEHASWCTNILSLILKSSWNHHHIKSFKPYPYQTVEVWNASSKAMASYSTLPQNWFNQEWLDINRSDSHIRVLIEPWRNGVSIPFTWLGRDWTVPMLNHAPVHHLHIIFFDIHLVTMISSVTSKFTGLAISDNGQHLYVQYLLPSVSVPPAVHIWFPPTSILEWLRQASTASGSGPQPWYRVGTGIYHTDDITKKTNFKIHWRCPKLGPGLKTTFENVCFWHLVHKNHTCFHLQTAQHALLHAGENGEGPRKRMIFSWGWSFGIASVT